MSSIKINLDSLNPKSFKKTVRHKVQDGTNIFRILPPFGKESEGYPYHKWNVVWGLVDPTSGRARPFASSSTYEGKCPVYDYLDLLKNKVTALDVPGCDESRIEALNKFISDLRPKTVYAYNAADKSGQIGVLELKSTAHKKVLSLMEKYIKDYNQDPTSLGSDVNDSGIWFNITKTGKGFDTSYDANKNQMKNKNAAGVLVYEDDRSPLAESIVHNFDALAYDLNGLYQKLTYDELKDILVANILNSAKDMPELLVEGFGLDENSVSEQEHVTVTTTTAQNRPTTANSTKPQGAGAKINLGKVEDVTSDTDDILAMADDLFNS
jgi:hypothetical protein